LPDWEPLPLLLLPLSLPWCPSFGRFVYDVLFLRGYARKKSGRIGLLRLAIRSRSGGSNAHPRLHVLDCPGEEPWSRPQVHASARQDHSGPVCRGVLRRRDIPPGAGGGSANRPKRRSSNPVEPPPHGVRFGTTFQPTPPQPLSADRGVSQA
jgi:hypothetical protein